MSFSTGPNKVILIDTRGGTEFECYNSILELIENKLYPIGVNLKTDGDGGEVADGIAKLERLRDVSIPAAIEQLQKDFELGK